MEIKRPSAEDFYRQAIALLRRLDWISLDAADPERIGTLALALNETFYAGAGLGTNAYSEAMRESIAELKDAGIIIQPPSYDTGEPS